MRLLMLCESGLESAVSKSSQHNDFLELRPDGQDNDNDAIEYS